MNKMATMAKVAGNLVFALALTVLPMACKPTQDNLTQSPTESSVEVLGQGPEQRVLDRFLGTWGLEATAFKAKWTPVEKRTTGTYTVTRTLGGKFNQQTGEDSEGNTGFALSCYDPQRGGYRFWNFGSNYDGPPAPRDYKWNEATRTMESTGSANDGMTSTSQMRFINDDTTITTLLIKDAAGEVLMNMEFIMTRLKAAPNATPPITKNSEQLTEQTPEQNVLDRLLGTWNQETTAFTAKWTPDEKRTTGTYSFARILGGKFVQETGEDSEKNSIIILYAYEQQRGCYRIWSFGSDYGGPDAPSTGKWNEATNTIEISDSTSNGQTATGQMRFVNDNTTMSKYVVKDAAGELLLNMEFSMTRQEGSPDATKVRSGSVPSAPHNDGELTGMCQNNLKQLGLIFKMFANESKGQCFPQLSPEAGRLMFSHEKGVQTYPVFPDYLTDLNVLICPGDKKSEALRTQGATNDLEKRTDDHSYFYLGYVVRNESEVQAFADAYKARVTKGLKFNEDLDGPQGTICQLREGIESKLVTEASNPAAAAKMKSEIPVLIERPGHHVPDGGNVLFMDGHVEFIRMGTNWIMTTSTLNILELMDKMKTTK